jgi:hypothetical protein
LVDRAQNGHGIPLVDRGQLGHAQAQDGALFCTKARVEPARGDRRRRGEGGQDAHPAHHRRHRPQDVWRGRRRPAWRRPRGGDAHGRARLLSRRECFSGDVRAQQIGAGLQILHLTLVVREPLGQVPRPARRVQHETRARRGASRRRARVCPLRGGHPATHRMGGGSRLRPRAREHRRVLPGDRRGDVRGGAIRMGPAGRAGRGDGPRSAQGLFRRQGKLPPPPHEPARDSALTPSPCCSTLRDCSHLSFASTSTTWRPRCARSTRSADSCATARN